MNNCDFCDFVNSSKTILHFNASVGKSILHRHIWHYFIGVSRNIDEQSRENRLVIPGIIKKK